MTKPILFFDFDDTKIDTIPAIVSYINGHYGIPSVYADYVNGPSLELIINKYLPRERHVSPEEAYLNHGKNFQCSIDIHEGIPAMDGMIEVVPLLAQQYEIWTVTAREKVCQPVIKHVLDKHVPGCIAGIHCVWEYRDGAYHGIQKRDFISSFKGEKVAFFDDSPKEILAVQDVIPSYLFDPRHLHDHMRDIQLRVRSWREISEILL
ncbi:MAG: hypothetical protein WCV82_04040 [Candidatus Paceibacterota bacterium]|jgi:5'(3')-deoxyribonucleotidase